MTEPPLSDELPEMLQRASEMDDPRCFRILDAIIAQRLREAKRKKLPPTTEPAA